MNIYIDKKIIDNYLGINVVFLMISDHEGHLKKTDCFNSEEDIVNFVLEKYSNTENINFSSFSEKYHSFYKTMGIKQKKVTTPLKQVQRVLKTKSFKNFNEIVTLCMKAEYGSMVSYQVYDLDNITGNLFYTISNGSEELIKTDGVRQCKENEIILKDELDVLHSSYYGNSIKSSVTKETKNFLIRVLGIPGIDYKTVMESTDELFSCIDNEKIKIKNTVILN